MFAADNDETDIPLPAASAKVDPNAPGYRPVDVRNNAEGVQSDLDFILSAALDELEDDELGGALEGGMKRKPRKSKDGKVGSECSELPDAVPFMPQYAEAARRSELYNATSEVNQGQDLPFSLSSDHATRFARHLMLFLFML